MRCMFILSFFMVITGCKDKPTTNDASHTSNTNVKISPESLHNYRSSYQETYGDTHNLMHFSNFLEKEINDKNMGAEYQAMFFDEIMTQQPGWEGVTEDPLDYFIKDFEISFDRHHPGSPHRNDILTLALPYYLRSKDQPVHPLMMEDLKGNSVALSKFKGKLIILDFWATWCVPCLEQMPFMEKVKERYSDDEDIVFISVSGDDKRDKWKKAIAKYDPKNELSTILPQGGKDPQLSIMDVSTFPVYQFIGHDGNYISSNGPKPESETFSKIIDMHR